MPIPNLVNNQNNTLTIDNFENAIQNAHAQGNKYIYLAKNGTLKFQGPVGNFFTSPATKKRTIEALQNALRASNPNNYSEFDSRYNEIFTKNHGLSIRRFDTAKEIYKNVYAKNNSNNYIHNNEYDQNKRNIIYLTKKLKNNSSYEDLDTLQNVFKDYITYKVKQGVIDASDVKYNGEKDLETTGNSEDFIKSIKHDLQLIGLEYKDHSIRHRNSITSMIKETAKGKGFSYEGSLEFYGHFADYLMKFIAKSEKQGGEEHNALIDDIETYCKRYSKTSDESYEKVTKWIDQRNEEDAQDDGDDLY